MPPRILVTRAPHQASELADRLRELGADPILIPTIEIADIEDQAVLDEALATFNTFHWLVFTSANAVSAFERRCAAAGFPSDPTTMPRIAAIGAATARALEAIGLHVNLIPTQAVAESLAEALMPHAQQPVSY